MPGYRAVAAAKSKVDVAKPVKSGNKFLSSVGRMSSGQQKTLAYERYARV
jgi:hypothetical protein